ncbi:MAG: glycosyltransferase, partial [bacterium]
ASFPAALAGAMLGVPLFVQEQNVVPGRVNRMLSRWAKGMFTAFEETARHAGCPVHRTGNPSRFAGTPQPGREECRERLGLDPGRRTVFAFGGSQGAAAINGAMLGFAALER